MHELEGGTGGPAAALQRWRFSGDGTFLKFLRWGFLQQTPDPDVGQCGAGPACLTFANGTVGGWGPEREQRSV